MKFADRTNAKYGNLTAIEAVGINAHKKTIWRCVCDCGKIINVIGSHLSSGNTTSCGCLKRFNAKKHGYFGTPEYTLLHNILQRCTNPSNKRYKDYGGRGIKVCEEWNSLEKFQAFLNHVGPRPSPKHSLDRWPDNNGDYKPGNVRWAISSEQNLNTRQNRLFTFNGITMCLTDWASQTGVPISTVYYRLNKGLNPDLVFRK